MSTRVLVTGSRTWVDADVVRAALAPHFGSSAVLVSGACPRGADAIAEGIWRSWGRYGRSAGFRRNAEMAQAQARTCAWRSSAPAAAARPMPQGWPRLRAFLSSAT
jgi:hypothetical protein